MATREELRIDKFSDFEIEKLIKDLKMGEVYYYSIYLYDTLYILTVCPLTKPPELSFQEWSYLNTI
jgi:hypothetical protein